MDYYHDLEMYIILNMGMRRCMLAWVPLWLSEEEFEYCEISKFR